MPATKLTLASLDTQLTVTAQYNPRELQINQPVDWHEHQPVGGTPDAWDIEFGGVKPQTLQLELLFDGAERDGAGVMESINDIMTLASATFVDPASGRRRPHFAVLVWGDVDQKRRMPRFTGIIESVATKYTMWSARGAVLRATCTVAMKECNPALLSRIARSRGGRGRTA